MPDMGDSSQEVRMHAFQMLQMCISWLAIVIASYIA
jgi:hypothetical protein